MIGKEDIDRTNDGLVALGPRIRALREDRRLSLRALAVRCELSTNAISLIERGESSPTVSTLHRIATALGTRITDLFEDRDEAAAVLTRRDERLSSSTPGLLMESLGIGLRGQRIEPFIVTLDPGPWPGDPVVHAGQELAHCLDGRVEYSAGSAVYELQAGDSLLFEASLPHSFRNPGETPAQFLLVLAADEAGDIARKRHLR